MHDESMSSSVLRAYMYGVRGLVNVALLRFDDAEHCMNRGIEIAPEFSYNYGLRAYARLRQENFEGAVSDCSAKISLKPQDAGAYALRAWAHYQQGNFESVACDLEHAISLEPARKWYQLDCLHLLDAYQELGAYEKTVAFASETLQQRKLDKDFSVLLLRRRAAAYHHLSQDDLALVDYNRAITFASKGEMIELFGERSKMYATLRQDDLAEKDRLTSLQLKTHKAQMSEWLPANPAQRLIAQVVDGFVVGCISAFILYLVACVLDIAGGGSTAAVRIEMAQWQSLTIAVFVLGFFDSIFVCLAPALIALILTMLFAGPDLKTLSMGNFAEPLAHPQLGLVLAVLVVVTVNWLYHSMMESSPNEATLGKSVFRLRVTDGDGARISFARSSMRHFLRVISSAIVVISLLAFWFVVGVNATVIVKAVIAVTFVFLFALGLVGMALPGLHNCLSFCLVSDSQLYYTPRFNLLTGPMEQDGV